MKKLALVLGSLLVVGTAASAKEVMPAPAVVPERIVEVVEKPVIVYRDREVESTAWRPNGSVDVHARFWGEIEGHKKGEKKWDGDSERAQLRTTAKINFTENQSLELHTRHNYGLKNVNNKVSDRDRVDLTHTYNFGNLGSSKVAAKLESQFRHGKATKKHLQFKPVFDFSEYFFKNDYVKATALELAPVYKYTWTNGDNNTNTYGVYANVQFDLPFGVDFQAEFDNLFSYDKVNETSDNKDDDRTAKYGNVEVTLGKTFPLYKEGRHGVNFRVEGVYETSWAYSRKDEASIDEAGTERTKGKTERWGAYTAKFEPSLTYNFQATDFVKIYARVAGEYKNRNKGRHEANYWRWQPTARLGFTASF